jgi:hypothetical protein
METEHPYLTELLELKEKNDTIDLVLDQLIFDNHLLARVPYRGIAPVVTNRRTTRRFSTVKFGLAHELEGEFYRTEEGKMMWAGGITQITIGTRDSMALGVVEELLYCELPGTSSSELAGGQVTREQYESVRLRQEVIEWDNARKGQKGMQMTVNSLKEKMRNQGGPTDDSQMALLMPAGARIVEDRAYYNNTYINTGSTKPGGIEDPGRPNLGVAGVRVAFESIPFRGPAGEEPYDPVFSNKTIGSYFMMKGTNAYADSTDPSQLALFSTQQLDIYRYRASQDDAYRQSYMDAYLKCGLYERNNAARQISPIGRYLFYRKTARNDQWVSARNKTHDQWNTDEAVRDTLGPDVTRRWTAKKRQLNQNPVAEWKEFCENLEIDVLDQRCTMAMSAPRGDVNVMTALDYYESIGRLSQLMIIWKRRSADVTLATSSDSQLSSDVITALSAAASQGDRLAFEYELSKIGLETPDFFDFCLHSNIPIYIPIKVAVPHQRWRSGTAVMVARGAGNVFVGMAKYNLSRNAQVDDYTGTFGIHFKAVVLDNRRVARAANCFVTRYIGGDNGKILDVYDSNVRPMEESSSNAVLHGIARGEYDDSCKTAVAFALPFGWTSASHYCDITGRYHPDYVASRYYHYPTAPIYQKMHKFIHRRASFGDRHGVPVLDNDHHNTIVIQGYQREFNPASTGTNGASCGHHSLVTQDRGHKGLEWTENSIARTQEEGARIGVPSFLKSGYAIIG